MTQSWYSFYVPLAEPQIIVEALQSVLGEHGYTAYDPFPGGSGTPLGLTEMVRQFVAPAQDNWVRVLGAFPEALQLDLSRAVNVPLLYAWLTEEDGGFAVLQAGQRHTGLAAFETYLRPDQSPEALQQAWVGKLPVAVLDGDGVPAAVAGAETLPADIQHLAQAYNVDPRKVSNMLEKRSSKLFKQLGREDAESQQTQAQARALFMGGGKDIWNNLHGQRVRMIASVLNLPANWRVPEWDKVRDAYQVHRLRQRAPRMALMPGDRETMLIVKNALDYTPVYMGQK